MTETVGRAAGVATPWSLLPLVLGPLGVDLGGSRRWVTLTAEHPRFAAEVRARQRPHDPAGRPAP